MFVPMKLGVMGAQLRPLLLPPTKLLDIADFVNYLLFSLLLYKYFNGECYFLLLKMVISRC